MEAALKHLPTNLILAERYINLEKELETITEMAEVLNRKLMTAETNAADLERGIRSLL
jgi:hypothetical protein